MAQTFSNGDEFLVDDSRSARTNQNAQSTQKTQSTSDLTEDGVELANTGGFRTQGINGVQATNDAQSKGGIVQVLGLAMGAAYTATCVSNPPWTVWACPLAAQSFIDSLAGGSAKKAAHQTGTYIDPTHANSNFDNSNGDSDISEVYTAQAQEGLKNLADMGYTVGPNGTVLGPDGQTFTPADYANAQALAAKGYSPQQIAEIQRSMASTNKAAASQAGVDLDALQASNAEGVGGGGSQGLGGGGYGQAGLVGADRVIEEIEYVGGNGRDKDKGRLPASQAAELSTNFNGDPIGISMANLFLIVHKKYKDKKKEKEFINKEY